MSDQSTSSSSARQPKAPNVFFNCEKCGGSVATYRSPSAIRKSKPRFCSLACLGSSQTGDGNPAWNGGRYIDSFGYVLVFCPTNPSCDCRGYILEHRLVMESILGRSLILGEVVHHKNKIKNDNRPENLELIDSQSEHMRMHNREDGNANELPDGAWSKDYSECQACRSSSDKHQGGGLCSRCYKKLWMRKKRSRNAS